MKAYDIVQRARDVERVSTLELIDALCTDFIELHGDRLSADDAAIVGGVGILRNGKPITIIGHQKGRDTNENIRRNFGASGPAGYRKAQRLMEQAEKFQRPILTLINTSGANATVKSEEGGISEAIASSLQVMSRLTVPTLAIVLGEGGSGGAIALALSDRVWMLENSTYSILSPEGFASILWKNAKLAPQAAELMRLTAKDLLELGVIERIIPENHGDEQISNDAILYILRELIQDEFDLLEAMPVEERLKAREERFRKF